MARVVQAGPLSCGWQFEGLWDRPLRGGCQTAHGLHGNPRRGCPASSRSAQTKRQLRRALNNQTGFLGGPKTLRRALGKTERQTEGHTSLVVHTEAHALRDETRWKGKNRLIRTDVI